MATEIERKFLVDGDGWRKGAHGVFWRQGYLAAAETCVVRVRVSADNAFITVKGKKAGLASPEYEYALPLADAREILEHLCLKPIIEKIRYTIDFQGLTWEIDEFEGENDGLVVAEVELAHAGQVITLPEWVGKEVSYDRKYLNVNLMKHPYKRWTPQMKHKTK